MIEIIAPTALLTGGGTWSGSSWAALDVDRVDFQVNNDVKIYPLSDAETALNQLTASTHQMIITGHITTDSALVGAGTFTKAKNLVLAAREWYIDLGAGGAGFPQVKWENSTWDFLIQKLMIIDTFAGADVINYQLSIVLEHT